MDRLASVANLGSSIFSLVRVHVFIDAAHGRRWQSSTSRGWRIRISQVWDEAAMRMVHRAHQALLAVGRSAGSEMIAGHVS